MKKEKLVRFESPFSWEPNDTKNHPQEKPTLPPNKVSAEPALEPEEGGSTSTGTKNAGSTRQRITIPKLGKFKVIFPENEQPWRNKVLDPGSDMFLQWNRVFLFFCIVALFVDPLFFYLPSVLIAPGAASASASQCMDTDLRLGIVVTCFRTLADAFYLLHMVIKFRTAFVSPSSRVFGKGELVLDPGVIATRYLRSDFFVDLVAALPLPQIVIWFIIPASRSSHSDHTNNALVMIVLLQYVPRLYLIFPLSAQIIKATGVVTKTAWAGAAYNLLLYMLASHVLGASWYLLSIERFATCWKSMCKKEEQTARCLLKYLDCDALDDKGRPGWINATSVFSSCEPGKGFNYGIFGNAVTNNVLSAEFLEKYLYSLWWGLQNLSSYGQGLETSTFIGETCFAILIAILGLVLFAHLIGNMQTYLQSITVRLEEWRLKRRDTEEWMSHRQLPQSLRERVRRFVQYKWLATRGVDEESVLRALPTDLRRDIQRHLCLDLVRRVPFFAQMDDQLLDAICERLVSSLSTQGTYIVREGDPVTEMLFVIRGKLESSTTNGGRTGFFNSIALSPGDFCGEELLSWALLPKSTLNMPSSTRTVRAVDEVEAFALRAEDLKFVANQFRRLHSKKLQHTFRFYSYHWRTWAACFIQAAWRRYKKRALAKNLSLAESLSLGDFGCGGSEREDYEDEDEDKDGDGDGDEESGSQGKMPQLGVTILASRFAANTRRGGAQKVKGVGGEMLKIRKPEEPDFSAEAEDERLFHSSLL